VGLLRRLARARLAARVMRRLRRAGFTDVRYDTRAFQVRFTNDDKNPQIVELTQIARTPSRKRVNEFVAGLTPGLPHHWREVKPLLRPVLRGATPGSPIRRPVLPYLSEFVVVDQPETMTYVSRPQLKAWNVKPDEIFEAARANLSGAVLHGRATEPVVVQFIDDGDAYWTSHLLLQHWLARLEGQVGGVPVAFAPERGTLLVTADGSDHLAGLFARAEAIYTTSSRAITPMAYVSDVHGCTTPYAAPEGHPLHRAVQRAVRVLALGEYARQAAQLPTAAPLRLKGGEEHGWRTQAVWERDEPVLLPRADEVLVGDRICTWDEVAERLTPVEDLEPPRWRAEHWPGQERRCTTTPANPGPT
jgi:hypothetical protein